MKIRKSAPYFHKFEKNPILDSSAVRSKKNSMKQGQMAKNKNKKLQTNPKHKSRKKGGRTVERLDNSFNELDLFETEKS